MRRIAMMMMVGALVGACANGRGVAREATAGAPQLVVATFNVNFGLRDAAQNLDAIADSGADVVLLQETTEELAAAATEGLAELYPYQAFRQCCRAGGLGILSKHRFREKAYIPSPIGWFPAWVLEVATKAGPVQVLNVHLRPPVSDSGSFVSGYFTTGKLRLEEMEAYAEHLDPEMPTVVVGDFNESSGKTLRYLEERRLTNALGEFDSSTPTWRWRTSVGTVTSRLDHVMYGNGLRALDARVLDAGISDHLPVVVQFELEQ